MATLRSPYVLALLWTLAVLAGISLPGHSLRSFDNVLSHDKFIHFGCFLGIAVLWVRARPSQWKRVLVLTLLAAWLSELYQGLLPWADRQPDPLDALANTLGLLVGTAWARRRYPAEPALGNDSTPPPGAGRAEAGSNRGVARVP